MSLCRDPAYVISQLRTQYLATMDDDQARRTMRPFRAGLHEAQFGALLTRTESPPIPVEVMEESELVQKLQSHAELSDSGEELQPAEQQPLPDPLRDGFMNSLKNSLVTLQMEENEVRRAPSKNVLSKLFRNNSSSNSTLNRSKPNASDRSDDEDDLDAESVMEEETEDADDDDDDHHDDDDASKIEINDQAGNTVDGSGIFVDQNYSDVNNAALMEQFTDDKYIFDNTVSSGDDELALDSDFSDDDSAIPDATFQNSTGPALFPKDASSFTPSKPARKLSFDSNIKPRSKRRPPLVHRKPGEVHSLKHSASMLDTESVLEQSGTFQRMEISQRPTVMKSKLTDLIGGPSHVSDKNPLEQFLFVSGDRITNKNDVFDIHVWLPSGESITLKIRRQVKVFEVIGYVLLKLTEQNSKLVDPESSNPNWWCCKLVEEDGEPYEGSFGLMDRVKPVGSYGENELALCKVSESEFRANELRTPMLERTASPTKNQNSYYKSILPHIDNDIKDSKQVTVKVFEYPYHPQSNSYVSFELLVTDTLSNILLKFSRVKRLNASDYVLKAAGEAYVLDLDDSLSSLDENYNLEVLTKSKARELNLQKKKILDPGTLLTINTNLTPQTLVLKPEPLNEKPRASYADPSTRKNSLSKHAFGSHMNTNMFRTKPRGPSILHTDINTEYHKYIVWRRLPMSFINRHERTLAIDGEYVYIMPNDEKLWYDTNFKTTTFHISQVMSCKVSKRVPANFKIVVMKASGPKRYVFEALNPSEAKLIISRLQTLMEAYKMNTPSVV